MVTSIRSRADHYETLRIAHTASNEEITRAFTSQMLTARMRPDITVARLAQLSVAYETLRDPAKRRAYDASLRVASRPSPLIPATAAPFIGGFTLDRLNRLAAPAPSAAEAPASASEPGAESRVADFIAASLRPQVKQQEPELRPSLPVQPAPVPRQEVAAQPPVGDFDESTIEDGRFSIGRTGATLAACVVGVAILSVALALPASNPDRLPAPAASESVKPAVTVPLPPVAAVEDRTAAQFASVPVGTSARLHASDEAAATAPKARPARSKVVDDQEPRMLAANTEPAALDSSTEQAGSTSAEVQTATPADSTIVTAAAANLPLPNATVARTIERIGYSCGRIAASEPVDGAAAGVFKITCTSGDSYQATPVRGRYHFRRWGGR